MAVLIGGTDQLGEHVMLGACQKVAKVAAAYGTHIWNA
jgi:hypothetical protein